jgi:hypothetical protein
MCLSILYLLLTNLCAGMRILGCIVAAMFSLLHKKAHWHEEIRVMRNLSLEPLDVFLYFIIEDILSKPGNQALPCFC